MSHLQGQHSGQTQGYGGNAGAYGQTYQQEHAYGQTPTPGYGTAGAVHSHPLHMLHDRDILTDMLLCEKQLLTAYGTAAVESTNPQLRQTLQQIAKTEGELHTKIFQMMHQRGWYETPRTDASLAKQIASLWKQKVEQHDQNQYSGQQTGQPQQSQYGDGQQWYGQPGAGYAAAKPWDTSQSSVNPTESAPQQVYGQSVFGTPSTPHGGSTYDN